MVGGRYSTALTNLEPDRRMELGENDEDEFLSHDIAVESREADRTRSFVGDTTPRTCGFPVSVSVTGDSQIAYDR